MVMRGIDSDTLRFSTLKRGPHGLRNWLMKLFYYCYLIDRTFKSEMKFFDDCKV